MPITYGSVCSGIEAATCAWHPLGWKAEWFAEIEPFPSAVLAHHYPNTPNLGDMTKLAAQVLAGRIPAPDILVGGTPCQAFSVAGMREGLADPRGALTIKYVELADATDLIRTRRGEPEAVIVWENVPGVLSDKGNAFGCFLGALAGEDCELQPAGKRWADAGCVYGPKRTIAWRILDAQYFGLAQRRRRVFVVASARAGFDPVAVLFEREGVRRDTAPRRGEGQDLAGRAPFGPALQCGCGHIHDLSLGAWGCPDCEGDEGPSVEVMAGIPAFGGENQSGSLFQAGALNAHGVRNDFASETFCVAPVGTLRATDGGSDVDHAMAGHLLGVAGTLQANGKAAGSATLQDAEQGLLLAFSCKDYGNDVTSELSPTLRAMGHGDSHANAGGQVAVALIQNALRGKDQNGLGVAAGDEPMYTLDQASQHAIFAIQAGALRTNPLSGPDGVGVQADHAYTLEARAEVQAVCTTQYGETAGTLTVRHDSSPCADRGQNVLTTGSVVRRLTPRECERLQGLNDDYTMIPWRGKPADECPDGPRYKAIGNSKAVPVVRWIGRRIQRELEA